MCPLGLIRNKSMLLMSDNESKFLNRSMRKARRKAPISLKVSLTAPTSEFFSLHSATLHPYSAKPLASEPRAIRPVRS